MLRVSGEIQALRSQQFTNRNGRPRPSNLIASIAFTPARELAVFALMRRLTGGE